MPQQLQTELKELAALWELKFNGSASLDLLTHSVNFKLCLLIDILFDKPLRYHLTRITKSVFRFISTKNA